LRDIVDDESQINLNHLTCKKAYKVTNQFLVISHYLPVLGFYNIYFTY